MSLTEFLILLGLFILFLGFGLLAYAQLFNLMLRFHIRFFPKFTKHYDRLLKELADETQPEQNHENAQIETR